MTHEILFRGKRIDNGEWDYGYPFIFNTDGSAYILNRGRDFIHGYKAEPDTFGRHTGMTDKNGVKIFEGDVIRGVRGIDTDEVFEVVYRRDQSFRKTKDGIYLYFSDSGIFYEVIGNIHDNPELF